MQRRTLTELASNPGSTGRSARSGTRRAVEAALHGDDHVVGELVPLFGQRAREHGHLDRRFEVLEHEHRHLVALLGELAGQPGDDAADVAPSRRPRGRVGSAIDRSTLRRSAASTPNSGWSDT